MRSGAGQVTRLSFTAVCQKGSEWQRYADGGEFSQGWFCPARMSRPGRMVVSYRCRSQFSATPGSSSSWIVEERMLGEAPARKRCRSGRGRAILIRPYRRGSRAGSCDRRKRPRHRGRYAGGSHCRQADPRCFQFHSDVLRGCLTGEETLGGEVAASKQEDNADLLPGRYQLKSAYQRRVCKRFCSEWRPVRDLNPCYRRERAMSWTGLDERDAKTGDQKSGRGSFITVSYASVTHGCPGGPSERSGDITGSVLIRQAALQGGFQPREWRSGVTRNS